MYPKVSVIVAAYNVEKYIKKCLLSLEEQSLKEIEVIIINDGSTDNTEKICLEFQKKDSRFKVITQKNAGLSEARNTGIKNSKSEFIAFVDGDDYVHTNMYELLYKEITRESADLVISGFKKIWEDTNGESIKSKKYQVKDYFLYGDFVKRFLVRHDEPVVVAWNKLFKREIISKNNLYFENKSFFEDVGFLARYLYYVNKISVVNESLYYYLQREGSITQTYNPQIEKSIENTHKILINFYKDKENYLKEIDSLNLRMKIYQYNYSLNFNQGFNWIPKISRNLFTLPLKHIFAIYMIKYSPEFYKKLRGIL